MNDLNLKNKKTNELEKVFEDISTIKENKESKEIEEFLEVSKSLRNKNRSSSECKKF